jgi:OOP family OmpA-OmpF porin
MHHRLFSLRSITQTTAALALIVPGVASAQGAMNNMFSEIYLGVGAGEAEYKDSNAADDTDTAWKAFLGFDVNKIIGIEAGYVDLGKITGAGFGPGPGLGGDVETTGWNIDARVGFPFAQDRASVFAKAGTFYADVERQAVGLSIDDTSWELTYGVGAEFDFARNVGIRAEWERFEIDDNDAMIGEQDVDLLSASLVFKFK